MTAREYVKQLISIHVLRVEDDLIKHPLPAFPVLFQSTSSVWRTTYDGSIDVPKFHIFQSTSSVWRTTSDHIPAAVERIISIHVLRVEDDGKSPAACVL